MKFTITPYEGYYVKSVKFNGNEAKGFETAGGIYISPPVTAGAELYVVFSRKPGIMETPYVFSHENEIFFFGRVYKNGGVKETGILISLNNPFPEEGNAETIKVPSVFPASSSGYFGFRLINSTGRESLICYIRPYAVYNNGNVAYGGVYRAETEAMKQIENFDTLEKRLEEMGFSETGIVRYVIGAEEESKDSVSEDTQLPNFD